MTAEPDMSDPKVVDAMAANFRGAAMADAEVWARGCMTWKDSYGVVHTGLSDPTKVQLLMFEHRRACRLAKVPCKMIVYKSRRMGASTGAQGIIYHDLARTGNLTAKLMANTDKTAGEVSDIFKLLAKKDRFPWPGLKGASVTQDVAGRTSLWNQSCYVDLSARGEEPGRGGAAQIADMTEMAHYPTTGNPVGGFLPSIEAALTSEIGLIIADSTPNGPQGDFYELCMLALKREAEGTQKLSDWKLIFVPWWDHHRASKVFGTDTERHQFSESLREDERLEWENHDPTRKLISLEAMHWRRMIIDDVLKGSVEDFRTEYPSSVREGFMRSARHAFNLPAMMKAYEQARAAHPIKVGTMSLMEANTKALLIPQENGATKIWNDPTYGHAYLVSWDSMTGADQASGGQKSNPDYHSIGVWRQEHIENGTVYPSRRVACHNSRVPIEVAAAEAHALSLYYGGCIIFPEVNNCGLAGVKALEALGANIFARTMANVTLNNTETANGWMTTEVTRKTIVAFMAEAIRKGMVDIPDPDVWEECLAFVIDPKKGRPEAMQGQKDDRVLESCIAVANMNAASRMDMPVRRRVTEAELMRRGGLVMPDGTRLDGYQRPNRDRFG